MKKIFTFLSLALILFSFKPIPTPTAMETKGIIIQFKNNNFEKRMPEIISNLKALSGLFYMSHCVSQNLFVLNFHVFDIGKVDLEVRVKEKIPVGLAYDVKEGTVKQMKENFGNCLIEETL